MLHGRTEMTSKKRLLALGLGALLVGIASTATAEEGFRPDSSKEKLPCPHPSEVTLILRKLFVEPKDFPGAAPPVLAAVIGTPRHIQDDRMADQCRHAGDHEPEPSSELRGPGRHARDRR